MKSKTKYHDASDGPPGTFSRAFDEAYIHELAYRSRHISGSEVSHVLGQDHTKKLTDFAALLSPEAGNQLEALAAKSQLLTQRYFGKTIRLFAPLYLSNECVNICSYCGFSRNNTIERITMPLEDVKAQKKLLAKQGFRSLLLVAGEHPKFVSNGYVGECVRSCLDDLPSINLELGPLETAEYQPLVEAGAEGLIVYQETYHKDSYEAVHTAGPKKHYAWRMDAPERGYAAGFRRLGIGALFGLYDWRYEALAVAAHAKYLLNKCWKAQISISLPRIRPAAGTFQPDPSFTIQDRELVQLVCALRLFLPTAGITLSTREPPKLRDGLLPLGITWMSAGSSTEPGGYHHFDETTWTPTEEQKGEQFHIADERSPQQIAERIRKSGYDPVWKDFDQAFLP